MGKGSVVRALADSGFWVTLDDVYIWRTGGSSALSHKTCTAFVKMASWGDVDTAIRLLDGQLVPELSSYALHAERALPRMSSLKKVSPFP